MTTEITIVDLAPDSAEGSAARVHDGLWVLARQWQFGELAGQDNGSPIGARMVVEAGLMGRWQPGGADSNAPVLDFDAAAQPTESRVEAEPWESGSHSHLRLRAEAGQALQRLLAAASLQPTSTLLKKAFALDRLPASAAVNAASERCAALLAGRTIDGVKLYRHLQPFHARGRLVEALQQPPLRQGTDDPAAVQRELARWMDDCASSGGLGERVGALAPAAGSAANAPAWQRERMEYAFASAAQLGDRAVTLVAREHFDGETDWYTYSIDPARRLAPTRASAQQVFTFLPTPVLFSGMPKPRFWELEDGHVNMPRLQAARSDAVSELFVDFVLRYGNDWFSVPLPLPAGSVSRLRSLVVTNTFGERLLIRHAGAGRAEAPWRMFALSVPQGTPDNDVFLLPQTLGQVLEGAEVEQVRLARDEMANLGWAVESSVESATGHRVDRHEQTALARPAPAALRTDALPAYRLGSSVPEHWMPLLRAAGRLVRGAAPRFVDGQLQLIAAAGRLLEPGQALSLYEEEVPREGIFLTRRYRHARSADGHAVLWIGRQKRPGQGESSSGLRFDSVEPVPNG